MNSCIAISVINHACKQNCFGRTTIKISSIKILKLPDLKFNITAIYQSKSKGTSRNMRIMIKKNKKKHHDQQKTRYYHVQTL